MEIINNAYGGQLLSFFILIISYYIGVPETILTNGYGTGYWKTSIATFLFNSLIFIIAAEFNSSVKKLSQLNTQICELRAF